MGTFLSSHLFPNLIYVRVISESVESPLETSYIPASRNRVIPNCTNRPGIKDERQVSDLHLKGPFQWKPVPLGDVDSLRTTLNIYLRQIIVRIVDRSCHV